MSKDNSKKPRRDRRRRRTTTRRKIDQPHTKTAPRKRISEMEFAWDAAVEDDHHDDSAMARYLDLARTFKREFGFSFSRGDGWDSHFNRMAFHASVEADLACRFPNDTDALSSLFSSPLIFTIDNPYPAEDPRQVQVESTLSVRQFKLMNEGFEAVTALPHDINPVFPMVVRFASYKFNGRTSYYDAVLTRRMLEDWVLNLELP
ncbi:hypothetical protein R3P38DRAFT_2808951 [Favolaschia claudopus]|uniref:Uncharacterized protein n=1 Tax=Favolaschia claudopus TaxID=2862362 RepID=A0AAV9ZEF2_9AGAR